MLFLSVILLSLLSSSGLPPQEQSTNKFIQLMVAGLENSEQALVIDQFMRTQPQILISRADPNTQIYFAIFPEAAGYTQSDFEAWFTQLGFGIRCYREGVHGIDQPYSKENYRCD